MKPISDKEKMLSSVANQMIELCRDSQLDRDDVAAVLSAVAASFCIQSGYPPHIFSAMVDARYKEKQQ